MKLAFDHVHVSAPGPDGFPRDAPDRGALPAVLADEVPPDATWPTWALTRPKSSPVRRGDQEVVEPGVQEAFVLVRLVRPEPPRPGRFGAPGDPPSKGTHWCRYPIRGPDRSGGPWDRPAGDGRDQDWSGVSVRHHQF